MNSNILTLLKRYVQTQYDHNTWVELMALSGLNQVEFDHKMVCPDEHTYALVGHVAGRRVAQKVWRVLGARYHVQVSEAVAARVENARYAGAHRKFAARARSQPPRWSTSG